MTYFQLVLLVVGSALLGFGALFLPTKPEVLVAVGTGFMLLALVRMR